MNTSNTSHNVSDTLASFNIAADTWTEKTSLQSVNLLTVALENSRKMGSEIAELDLKLRGAGWFLESIQVTRGQIAFWNLVQYSKIGKDGKKTTCFYLVCRDSGVVASRYTRKAA